MVWEFLEGVTAEVGFRARAPSLEGLLKDVVRAVGAITSGSIKLEERREINLDVSDPSLAVFDLINEIVFLKDTEGMAFGDAEITITGDAAKVVLLGSRIDDSKARMDIKSPTFHNLDVKKNGEWEVTVVLDV